jgi:hypothetical protein
MRTTVCIPQSLVGALSVKNLTCHVAYDHLADPAEPKPRNDPEWHRGILQGAFGYQPSIAYQTGDDLLRALQPEPVPAERRLPAMAELAFVL